MESKQHSDSKPMKTTEYAFHRGSVAYLINLIAEESAHDKYQDQLQAILKSMVFKEAKPANGTKASPRMSKNQ